MRKTNELIELLFQIYTSNDWQEMEEYFEAAYALLMFHGAKFKELGEVMAPIIEGIRDTLSKMGYSPVGEKNRREALDKYHDLIDNDEELKRLNKLNDSEDGFREYINAGPDDLEYFTSICHKFITFKY